MRGAKKVDINFSDVEHRLAQGESLRSIAKSYGISHQTLSERRRRNNGKPLRTHRTVNGGKSFIDQWGYVMIRTDGKRSVNPNVPEHILIAEQKIARRLLPGEVVHHINGDKKDNRPENLFVCTRSKHRELHRSLEELAMELVCKGEIILDGEVYRWKH